MTMPPEKEWPFDVPDRIFYGRARRAVGRWKFGAAWDDTAPLAEPTYSEVRLPASLDEANKSLTTRLRTTSIIRLVMPNAQVSTSCITEAEWAAAVVAAKRLPEVQKQKHLAAVAGYQRQQEVSEFLRKWCAFGELSSFIQWPSGKMSESLDVHIWNTRRFETWFECGRLSDVDIGGHAYKLDSHSLRNWLFFSATDLDGLTQQVDQASNPKPDKAGKLPRQQQLIDDWVRQWHGGKIPTLTQPRMLEDLAKFAATKPGSTPPKLSSLKSYLERHGNVSGE